jgi:Tfp pilus assembly protein PilO
MSAHGFLGTLRRYPYSATCALLSILLGALAWFLWNQNHELEIARQEKNKEGEAMLALLVGGSTQRQELATVRETTRRIEDNLLLETNLAENYWYFYKLEEQTQARLQVHQLSSPPGDTSPLFKRIPYTLRVSGTYEQVAAFLLGLETGPRLINITNFSYARRDATGSNLALDLSIELLGKK